MRLLRRPFRPRPTDVLDQERGERPILPSPLTPHPLERSQATAAFAERVRSGETALLARRAEVVDFCPPANPTYAPGAPGVSAEASQSEGSSLSAVEVNVDAEDLEDAGFVFD